MTTVKERTDIGTCQACGGRIKHGQPYMPAIPFVNSWGGFSHQYCPPRLVGVGCD